MSDYSHSWTGTTGADWSADWTFVSTDTSGTTSRSIQTNAGRQTAGASGAYRNDRLTGLANVANFDLYITLDPGVTSGTVGNQPAVFFREGNGSTVTGFYLEATFLNPSFGRLRLMHAPAYSGLGDYLFTHVSGTVYRMRIRAEGTAIKAKIWPIGDSEPGTWGLEVTSNLYTTGRFGLTLYSPDATARTVTWDDLSITDLNLVTETATLSAQTSLSCTGTTSGGSTPVAYATEVLADNPWWFYTFDQTASSTIFDTSANGRHAVLTGTATFNLPSLLPYSDAKAIRLANSYISRHLSAVDETDAFSIEFWFSVGYEIPNYPVSRSLDGDSKRWYFQIIGGRLRFFLTGADSIDVGILPTQYIDDDLPHHVVAVVNADRSFVLYIDGVSAGVNTAVGVYNLYSSPDITIGRWRTTNTTDIIIDNVAYYRTALSVGRVLAHYNAAITPPATVTVTGIAPLSTQTSLSCTGTTTALPPTPDSYTDTVLAADPLWYLRLSEQSGSVALDASGNLRHGTYLGSPALAVQPIVNSTTDKAVALSGDDRITVPSSGTATAATFDFSAYDLATYESVVIPDGVAPSVFDTAVYDTSSYDVSFAHTIEVWFRTTYLGAQHMVTRGAGSTSQAWRLSMNNGQVIYTQFQTDGTAIRITSPQSYADDLPHHAVGVATSESLMLFVDGVLVADDTSAVDIPAGGA